MTNDIVQRSGDIEETCDCFRSGCCNEDQITENRFSRVRGVAGGTGRVSFINQVKSYTWHPHGHVNLTDFDTMRRALGCKPGACNGTKSFYMNNHELVRSSAQLNATHLVLNFGYHWNPDNTSKNYMDELFQIARRTVPNVFWRTTTISKPGFKRGKGQEIPVTVDIAMKRGVTVLDYRQVNANLVNLALQRNISMDNIFVDGLHFTCPIYTHLNELFLEEIC